MTQAYIALNYGSTQPTQLNVEKTTTREKMKLLKVKGHRAKKGGDTEVNYIDLPKL